MKRYLTPAPLTYHLNRLSAEIQAQMPEVQCINEVETDQRYIAVYTDVDIDEQALTAIVAAHDPTPPVPIPTDSERIAAVEMALLDLLLKEV